MAIPKSVCNELVNFNTACKEFCDSKIILIEKSISNILKSIARGGALYSAIAEKIVGYNFGLDIQSVNESHSFDVVFSEKKVIPFVFYLLNEMDNGNIDTFEFIKLNFGEDSEVAYGRFAKSLIIPFNQQINEYIQSLFKDKNPNNEEMIETAEHKDKPLNIDQSLKNRIKFVVGEIINKLNAEKYERLNAKTGVSTIAVSVQICLTNNECIGIYGLLLGIRNILKSKFAFRNDLKELNLIIKVFENM